MSTCVHYRFEDRVRQTPGAIALMIGDRGFPYDELDGRANQLVNYLIDLRVGRNELVAVRCEFGLELIVALLGVLKASAAYVPIDSTCPFERMKHVMEQTGRPVLLTQSALDSADSLARKTVRLDSDWPEIAQRSSATPAHRNTVDDLIYCIFTSGSTGNPKGALNSAQFTPWLRQPL